MAGDLIKDSIVIADEREGSQIFNKGFYGYPRQGGGLELDLLEALYLLESDRLNVNKDGKRLDFAELYRRSSRVIEDLHTKYIVYRDLRQRGYIVKTDQGGFDFRVYSRGANPHTSPAQNWAIAISERNVFNIAQLLDRSETAERTRKELILGIVDEEGDLTYYTVEGTEPCGHTVEKGIASEGGFIDDAVIIIGESVSALYEDGFYGKRIGPMLQLSLIEAAHLMDKGRLELKSIRSGQALSGKGFLRIAKELQPDFNLRMKAYKDLKGRGLVVKTGFKYGTHFRVYEGNPSKHHSKYLVHVVPDDYSTVWAEISRAVRLAHGVKKDILFASVSGEQIRYIKLKRVRP